MPARITKSLRYQASNYPHRQHRSKRSYKGLNDPNQKKRRRDYNLRIQALKAKAIEESLQTFPIPYRSNLSPKPRKKDFV